MPFSCFYNKKKQALSVSYLTVALCMMSNNRRSVSSIGFVNIRLILQQVCYSPDEEVLDDCHHFFEFSVIGIVLSACFFYWQVVIDHWCRSAVVTHHSQSNCLMRKPLRPYLLKVNREDLLY
jgi:hypothetical protein